jgi:DNA polymerase III delta prime subunit
MNSLFHAYIIGGARESAKEHIAGLLSACNISQERGQDYAVSECVTFSIDDARALKEWQILTPLGKQKVHVLYADFITLEAQNALLKTFEEPADNTHIILAVPQPEMLLETLLSRAQVIIPTTAEGNTVSAQRFLQSSVPERLTFVQKLLEKSEDEEASAQVREKALSFVNQLEEELSKKMQENKEKLEMILKLKKHLYMSGSSVRIILETLALTIQ